MKYLHIFWENASSDVLQYPSWHPLWQWMGLFASKWCREHPWVPIESLVYSAALHVAVCLLIRLLPSYSAVRHVQNLPTMKQLW